MRIKYVTICKHNKYQKQTVIVYATEIIFILTFYLYIA